MTILVEVLAHMRRIAELAGQFVGPGVVGADELRDDRTARVQQTRPTMATDIVQHADFAFVVPQEDEAGPADVDHRGVAGFRNVAV
ncbi:hypothetical protein D3C71_1953080 [compost metagenome]